MDLPTDEEIALARRLLLIVGVVYLVVQLFAFSLDRPPSWDEAIYLSQVSPGAVTLPFLPYRARGITFIALPVLQFGGSLSQLRLFLAVASAAALTASFRAWASVIGFGAVGAAFLFVGVWPTLVYGSELMPNLWVAVIGVAATAVLARRIARGEGRYDELLVGGLVALAALIRPLDAIVLTSALLVLPIVIHRATVSWTVHLLLGAAAGLAPWLVEMTTRFGSPGAAISAAARFGPAGSWSLFENVRQYLALGDGPTIGPDPRPELPVVGILWLLGLVTLVIVGVRTARSRGLFVAVLVPVAAGVALAAEYVAFTDALAPRFLLPALAVLSVPAGLGLASIVVRIRGRDGPTSAGLGVVVATSALVAAWTIVQLGIATTVEGGLVGRRSSAERVGTQVRELAANQPCHVFSEVNYPIMSYAAGCRGSQVGTVLGAWDERAEHLERRGILPFLVLHRADEPTAPAGANLIVEVPSQGAMRWFIYGAG
ncbi:MAG: hypothetical protein ACRDGO_11395 [Actinomycetota bacterium]